MPARRPQSHHGSHAGNPPGVRAALRPCPGDVPGFASRVLLREPGRRAGFPEAQVEHLDELIVPLVTARTPGLSKLMLAVPPPWSCA